MESLNIEKFNPNKAELQKVVDKYSSLKIQNVDDKEGYSKVDYARKDLKQKRVLITNTGKELRAEAITFQRSVINIEKELVGIIEPLEKSLQEKQDKINDEKEMVKKRKLLPERREKMELIELDVDDDFILKMDNNEFYSFYNEKRETYFGGKRLAEEKKIADEKQKIEDEKAKFAEDKRVAEATKVAEKEAQNTAIKDAEIARQKAKDDKDQAIEDERQKARDDKEALIAKHKKEDEERIEKEKEVQRIKDEKIAYEKKEKEALEKKQQYQKFLKDNGYTEKNKDDFYIMNCISDNTIILYKKVNQFKIK